jgi:hypothetical protein
MKAYLACAATAAFLSLGFVAMSSGPVAARVVCNSQGDCWHTDSNYHPHGVRFETHNDDWYFHRDWDHDRDHHWRGYHDGRGYWNNGVWIAL